MIKILIVDDSQTSRLALRRVLEKDADILVIGEAADGQQALSMIKRYDPHFVTMDIHLEHENGLDITKTIMATCPRPILVVTSANTKDPELIYQVLERGALDVVAKPPGPLHAEYEKRAAHLIRMVKTLAEVPVLHQRRVKTPAPPLLDINLPSRSSHREALPKKSLGMLLIGASTGGPPVVCGIIAKLPKPLSIPVIVVQHITRGFAKGFADWLTQSTGHHAVLVEKTLSVESGFVYVASDNADIVFSSSNTLRPRNDMDSQGAHPSIDRLFISAAEHCRVSITAMVLTGMGSDGAAGLAALREAGAVTLVQDPDTCAVDSMPQSAIKNGAAQRALAPEEIADYLKSRLLSASVGR